jgi:hypothetical protein
VLSIALPPAGDAAEQAAYQAFAGSFAGFNPRIALEE